jgi:DNA-binding CsgD family transcriptional regulator
VAEGDTDIAAARAIFDRRQLGARSWSRQTRAVPVDRAHRLDALTPAERAVVAAIFQGATNQVAALRLGKQPETVSSQLGSAYRKLGVEHRGELLALLREIGYSPDDRPRPNDHHA